MIMTEGVELDEKIIAAYIAEQAEAVREWERKQNEFTERVLKEFYRTDDLSGIGWKPSESIGNIHYNDCKIMHSVLSQDADLCASIKSDHPESIISLVFKTFSILRHLQEYITCPVCKERLKNDIARGRRS